MRQFLFIHRDKAGRQSKRGKGADGKLRSVIGYNSHCVSLFDANFGQSGAEIVYVVAYFLIRYPFILLCLCVFDAEKGTVRMICYTIFQKFQ